MKMELGRTGFIESQFDILASAPSASTPEIAPQKVARAKEEVEFL
jgi:hypothetical protein